MQFLRYNIRAQGNLSKCAFLPLQQTISFYATVTQQQVMFTMECASPKTFLIILNSSGFLPVFFCTEILAGFMYIAKIFVLGSPRRRMLGKKVSCEVVFLSLSSSFPILEEMKKLLLQTCATEESFELLLHKFMQKIL